MPGFAPISLQQFMNPTTGRPYAGARAAFYEASTNTPITVYSDYGLGEEHPNPVLADEYGRFPAIFIDEAVGFYRLRITDRSGSVLPLGSGGSFDIPVLPVVGPSTSDGGGSEVPVDPNALLQTGDVIWVPKTGTRSGFVRLNGRTIGSASSGASERANADTEDLYSYIWTNFADTICAVTGGRGISAAADFAANKPIATLDMRSRAPFGLDDMGNSALSAFSGVTFAKGNATTAGASGGSATKSLATSEIPSHAHNVYLNDPGHRHTVTSPAGGQTGSGIGASTSTNNTNTGFATTGIEIRSAASGGGTANITATAGGGAAFDKMSPFVLGSWLWKL
jgi:microcystin-dependent protein